MSTPNQQQPTPAGWYADPDPQNAGGQRWWDGARWTEHSRQAQQPPQPVQQNPSAGQAAYAQQAPYAQPGYAAPVVYPPVAPDTSSLTLHVWFVVGLPLLTSIAFLFIDFTGYIKAITFLSDSGSSPTSGDYSQFGSAVGTFVVSVLIIDALGLIVYGLGVMFAYFDHRALAQRGFARPFHWAWSFLSGAVYIIGRTVVARRRGASDAMWPIWGLVAVYVISIALAIIKAVMIANMLGGALSPYVSSNS